MKKKSSIVLIIFIVILIIASSYYFGLFKSKADKLYDAIEKSLMTPVKEIMDTIDESDKNEAGTTTNITIDLDELTFNNKFINFFVGGLIEKYVDKIDVCFKQRYNKQQEAKLYQFQAGYDGIDAVDTTYIIEKDRNGIYNRLYDDKYYVMDDETFAKLVGSDPIKLFRYSSLVGSNPEDVMGKLGYALKLIFKNVEINTAKENLKLPVSNNAVDCVKYTIKPTQEQWKLILESASDYAEADYIDIFFTLFGVNKNSAEIMKEIETNSDALAKELVESESKFEAYIEKGSVICSMLSVKGSSYWLEKYGSLTDCGILGFKYDGKTDESKTNYIAFETDLQKKNLEGNFVYNTAYGNLLSYDFSIDLSGVSLNDMKKLELAGCNFNADGYFEYKNIRFNSSFETVLGVSFADSVLKIGNVDFGVISVDAIDVNIITSVKSDTKYPANLERIDISGEDVSKYNGLFPGTLSFLLNIFINKPNE